MDDVLYLDLLLHVKGTVHHDHATLLWTFVDTAFKCPSSLSLNQDVLSIIQSSHHLVRYNFECLISGRRGVLS